MILEPTTAIVGALAFGLHLYGKFAARTKAERFGLWAKENVGYILSSAALCALGILLKDEVMEPLGFTKPLTYIAVMCYGGAHLISRVIGMNEGAKMRKA
jgi:hypothetical protein